MNREDILARKAARDRIAAEIEKLQGDLEIEDRWLEAVRTILPPKLAADLLSSRAANGAASNKPRSVWRRAVEAVLSDASRGLLPKEIAQAIREGGDDEAKDRLAGNPNGLYNMVATLVDEGTAVKHREKFYSAQLYNTLNESGDLDDDADDSGLTGVNLYVVNGIKISGAMSPKTIIEMMKEDEGVAAKIAKNPQYGYSVIARLTRQGHIWKDGDGSYRLSSDKNGAPDVQPSNAPDVELEAVTNELVYGPGSSRSTPP